MDNDNGLVVLIIGLIVGIFMSVLFVVAMMDGKFVPGIKEIKCEDNVRSLLAEKEDNSTEWVKTEAWCKER